MHRASYCVLFLFVSSMGLVVRAESPPKPGGVEVKPYRTGSAWVRWGRVMNAESLEVVVDGKTVKTTSGRGRSAYVRALAPGRHTAIVVAVNMAGRSESKPVVFVIPDSGSLMPTGPPSAPKNLVVELDDDRTRATARWIGVRENSYGHKIAIDSKHYTTVSRTRNEVRIPIPQTPGKHTVQIFAYNRTGETGSNIATITVREDGNTPAGDGSPSDDAESAMAIRVLESKATEGTGGFTVEVTNGRGKSLVKVELWRDGKVAQSWLRETTSAGKYREKLMLIHGLIGSSADRDGFELRVFHDKKTKIFKVTVFRGLTISVGANKAQEGSGDFPISVERGIGRSQIKAWLLHDGKVVQEMGFKETDGSGDFRGRFELRGGLITNGADADGFVLRIAHAGLRKEFRVTVTRKPSESSGPAKEIPPPKKDDNRSPPKTGEKPAPPTDNDSNPNPKLSSLFRGLPILDRRNRTDADGHYFIIFASRGGSPTGHAFVTWAAVDHRHRMSIQKSRGFYPRENGKDVIFGNVPGEIRNEATNGKSKLITNRLIVRVNRDAYVASQRLISQWAHATSYNLARRNCNSFVGAVAKTIGLEVRGSTFAFPSAFVGGLIAINKPRATP